jgi:hypothetical protein
MLMCKCENVKMRCGNDLILMQPIRSEYAADLKNPENLVEIFK